MASHTRILSIAGVLALGALTAFAAPQGTAKSSSQQTKTSTPKVSTHVVEGSVVAVSNDSLTLRSGKKDMTFKLNSATQKPASLAAWLPGQRQLPRRSKSTSRYQHSARGDKGQQSSHQEIAVGG